MERIKNRFVCSFVWKEEISLSVYLDYMRVQMFVRFGIQSRTQVGFWLLVEA
jgi:hypothetical protein